MKNVNVVQQQNLESKLRKRARQRGLRILKSRTRNPESPGYQTFMIVNADTRSLVYGWDSGYGLGLAAVEEFLKG